MKRNELQAMQHYARGVQKVLFKSYDCVVRECDNCDYAHLCEVTNLLLKLIEHDLCRYDAKGKLKDDND